ncbi:MAG: response regulator [Alphaproteobacteria bacterium]|nr:response regulator [Alphaproteobacteria bacterium]MCA0450441.1 response regulator [Pseudomonadota bacterium]
MTAGRRLVVCDDEPEFRNYIRRAAEASGFDVRETGDPMGCADLVRDFAPEILVLDIVMPDMDGIEVLTAIAATGFSGRVLLCSGYDPNYMTSAARLAAIKGVRTEILSKPVRLDALKAALA